MSAQGRPLLAARTQDDTSNASGAGGREPNDYPQKGRKTKRTLIESACAACRKRKSRCDGNRPGCSRCQTLGTECIYSAEEGESRWAAMRRRASILETERDEIREMLLYLRHRPEAEATELFTSLRNGSHEQISDLVRRFRENDGNVSTEDFPTGDGNEQRLPSISSMLNFLSDAQITVQAGPAAVTRRPTTGSDGSEGSGGSVLARRARAGSDGSDISILSATDPAAHKPANP